MILVTGATGSIGTSLVRELRSRGEDVRAFVRDEERGRRLGVDLALGDLDDPLSVARALVGVDRVLLNAGGAIPAPGEQPMVAQQRTVIDAAARGDVEHLVKISVWGAREGGELAEGAHWEIERHLAASGLSYAVLAPSGFMQNFLTGAGAFSDHGDLIGAYGEGRVSYVDAADIAACAAVLLTGSHGDTETHVVTGPQALTHREIAAAISKVLGRTVRYRDLPGPAFADRLVAQGLPEDFAQDVATLFGRVAEGRLEQVTTTVADLTGRPARTFAEFLAAHRDELVAAAALPLPRDQ